MHKARSVKIWSNWFEWRNFSEPTGMKQNIDWKSGLLVWYCQVDCVSWQPMWIMFQLNILSSVRAFRLLDGSFVVPLIVYINLVAVGPLALIFSYINDLSNELVRISSHMVQDFRKELEFV